MAAHGSLSDEERIQLATQRGSKMHGPLERYRCDRHPRRWVTYRWTWPVPADGDHMTAIQSDSEPVFERACAECDAEDDDLE